MPPAALWRVFVILAKGFPILQHKKRSGGLLGAAVTVYNCALFQFPLLQGVFPSNFAFCVPGVFPYTL